MYSRDNRSEKKTLVNHELVYMLVHSCHVYKALCYSQRICPMQKTKKTKHRRHSKHLLVCVMRLLRSAALSDIIRLVPLTRVSSAFSTPAPQLLPSVSSRLVPAISVLIHDLFLFCCRHLFGIYLIYCLFVTSSPSSARLVWKLPSPCLTVPGCRF